MFGLKKKTEPSKKEIKPEPKKIYIASEHIRQFYELIDEYHKLPDGQDHAAKHQLWDFIGKLHPETLEGSWRWKHDNIMHPYLVEIPD